MRVEPYKEMIKETLRKGLLNAMLRRSTTVSNKRPQIEEKDEIYYVEPFIGIYKITADGRMSRFNEIPVDMGGRKFFNSQSGNMMLTRSRCKGFVSLVNFDQEEKNEKYMKLVAYKINTRQELKIDECVNQALSDYYKANRDRFQELVEVSLVGCHSSKKKDGTKSYPLVQLTYLEKAPRDIQEQLGYELEITQQMKDDTMEKTFSKRDEPRVAKKFVFFNFNTGTIELELGGVQPPMDVQNQNQQDVKAYMFGLSVKQNFDEGYEPQLQLFIAGDFLSTQFKSCQIIFKWAYIQVQIPMQKLMQKDPEVRLKYIETCILAQIPKKNTLGTAYFLFDNNWIEKQKFNWEVAIEISVNNSYEQHLIINKPLNESPMNPATVMVNGPRFQPRRERGKEPQDVPYYIKMREDCAIKPGRNNFIKDQLFMVQTINNERKTFCVRIENKEVGKRVINFGINKSCRSIISTIDMWLQLEKVNRGSNSEIKEYFQVLSVTSGDQNAHLETKERNSLDSSIQKNQLKSRKSDQFYQSYGDQPFVAYNLGSQRIALHNTLKNENNAFILNIPENEKFVCWISYNSFTDLGFYPNGLRVECCSNFVYLTTSKESNDDVRDNRLNLLMIDPFQDEIQVALFKSNYFIDDVFLKHMDFPIRSFIQATMVKKHDKKFKQYIWTQFTDCINRSKFLRQEGAARDSDDDKEEMTNNPTDEQIEQSNKTYFLPNLMIQDPKDFIYYIIRQNGICKIIEGNPRDPYLRSHSPIFETKSDDCLGFYYSNDTFYFMDDKYICFKLTRNENNRMLKIEKELTMKEIQRLDFQPKGKRDIILKEKFGILGSQTFFLYDVQGDSHPDGIFEAEELIIEDRNKPKIDYIAGPTAMRGTGSFMNFYRTQKYKCFYRIFDEPDQNRWTLVNDSQNYVDMSTFLQDGNILIKCRRRFQVFTAEGVFIDEVTFTGMTEEDDEYDKKEEDFLRRKGFKSRQEFKSNQNEENVKSLEEARRKKEPILDFLGDPYIFKKRKVGNSINQLNKMELLQFSQNNRFFLFLNRMSEKLFVYELCQMGVIANGNESWVEGMPDIKEKITYHMKKYYELKTDRSYLFQHMYLTKIDPLKHFMQDKSQIQIDNHGHVSLCYIENLPSIENQHQMDTEEQEQVEDANEANHNHDSVQHVKCRAIGSIFTENERGGSDSKSFNEIISFPKESQQQLKSIVQGRIEKLEGKIRAIRAKQSRMPPKLFDYQEYELLIENLEQLEFMECENIFAKIYNHDLLIIYCGSYIRYSKIKPNPEYVKAQQQSNRPYGCEIHQELSIELEKGSYLQNINLMISREFEIIRIEDTLDHDVLQMVMINHDLNLMQITAWDFKNNSEKMMKQLIMETDSDTGYHLVKGMNVKMNYLIDKNYITELECNIHLWQKNIDQQLNPCKNYSKQSRNIKDYFNQTKLYQNSSRFLGTENSACLFFNLSKLDILYWQNVMALGGKSELIKESASLDKFNLMFDNNSLFHYFAADSEVIEDLHYIFRSLLQNESLTEKEKNIPLLILNSNQEGKNALQLCIDNQSPKSFECLVDLLKEFKEVCVTRLMLNTLNNVLSHDSPNVINFFETAIYQPPLMQMELFVPWKEGMDEFIFPSHTAYISREFLVQKLKEEHKLKDDPKYSHQKRQQSYTDSGREQDIIKERRKLRDWQLDEEFQEPHLKKADNSNVEDEDILIKRVQVEALDFDWIFQEGNCKTLLNLLAEEANNSALTTKTIRIFVAFMWSYYKTAIVRHIFLPYLVYLLSLIALSSGITTQMIDHHKNNLAHPGNENVAEHRAIQVKAYSFWLISFILMLRFSQLELKQLWLQGLGYFNDFWNTIDAISVSCNATFLVMVAIDFYKQEEYISLLLIRTLGGFVNFFMWIKVFYWMRIFTSLAYYVNLIVQTISDSSYFMVMVMIIICAFANFFYVLNINFVANHIDHSYFDTYYGFMPLDAILSIYELGVLGNYDVTVYREGYDKAEANIMFFIATFIITVVFMNMLIAIMSDTFAQVQEVAEERGLNEQVVLIDDHSWLLNLGQIFKGKKYIIVVKPGVSSEESNNSIADKVKEAEFVLHKKIQRVQSSLQKKMDQVSSSTTFMLNNQYDEIIDTKLRISQVEKKFKSGEQSFEEEVKEEPKKAKDKATQDKKNMMIKELNAKLGTAEMNTEMVYQIAVNWMEIADVDKNGVLTLEEFQEFFSHLEGIVITDDEMEHIFSDIDENDNGTLTQEEFAQALCRTILSEDAQDEPSSDEGSEDDIEVTYGQ